MDFRFCNKKKQSLEHWKEARKKGKCWHLEELRRSLHFHIQHELYPEKPARIYKSTRGLPGFSLRRIKAENRYKREGEKKGKQ
ncbi:hypothetical protein HMPREF6123_2140 [Oribacterium sinus F0268]|uniref:Uncharacterized protein n=1 Tax=Oribacterium sinus F0268 TaxID=585501 RepID=C2L071_9FIRM|nr:hypothetical protein HMPREF6123_2140 [Oribacterium sinus F0268]